MNVTDALDIVGKTRVDRSLSTTGAATAAFSEGCIVTANADVDCFLKIEATSALAAAVTTSTGWPLYAGNQVRLRVPTGYFVGGVVASGTGTLTLFPVGGLG